MKKFILSALCALGLVGTAAAQDVFAKGDQFINLGIGVSTGSYNTTFPPISLTYERSVIDGLLDKGSIGIGGQVEFRSYKYGNFRGSSFFVGPRATFHYEFVDRLDTYAGINAGLYYHTSFLSKDGGDGIFAFAPDVVIGTRYLFSDGFGVFAEIGSGISTFKLGATFSF